MNGRTKRIWAPGLVVFAASMVWMMALQRFHFATRAPWAHSGLPMPMYLLWLLPQPVFGGIGAYLSRRAGGGRESRLVSSLFPSIVMFVMICGVIAFGIFAEKNPHIMQQPFNILLTFLSWVVLPGIALLFGGLLFQKPRKLPVLQG